MLRFTVRQFKRFDNKWGALDDKTGLWNGMISNLVNQEADFLPVSLAQCCKRSKVIDYLWTLTEVRRGFAIKSLLSNSYKVPIKKTRQVHHFLSHKIFILAKKLKE